MSAGLTRDQVAWRVGRGLWVPVAGNAYRLAGQALSTGTLLHAVRLTWPDAVVGLGTAARVHRLPVADDGLAHVVLRTTRAPSRNLAPHEIRLDPGDVELVDSVAVTTRTRTIVDCLGRLPADQALDLLAWVSSRRLMSEPWLAGWIEAHPHRWGNVARARAAERLGRGAVNPAEDRLLELMSTAGIDGWRAGVSLLELIGVPAQADVYFPDIRLVIEVDGRRGHAESRFQSDRTRQNALVAAGCVVLRYTWADLQDRPTAVVAQVRAMVDSLGRRRAA
jgi:hypothetical protein